MICQDCKFFIPQQSYDNLLGQCTDPLVIKLIGNWVLVNNTSEELKCGGRGTPK